MKTKREAVEWCDVWVTGAADDHLPRVLLVGDSIARSYFPGVRDALAPRVACAYLATSRSVCDPAFERELALVLDDHAFAAIQFNNGLHGWDYDEATYGRRLREVLGFVAGRVGPGRLAWASSTPIRRRGALAELDARTPRVVERNRIATAVAADLGLPTHDLCAVVWDHPEYHAEDGVHFNAAGQRALAARVAEGVARMISGVVVGRA